MVWLIQYELKKMLFRPFSIMAILITLAVNTITICSDSGGSLIQRQDIEMQKVEQYQYAGAINQEWANLIETKLQEVRGNLGNLISQDEQEQVRQDYLRRGYTKEYVNSMDNTAFLKPELLHGLAYRVLLDAEASSEFYDNAQKMSVALGNMYRTEFDGKQGEVLAAKAEGMYGHLAQRYTAYYDYNLGWNKLISLQKLLPFTVGLFLLVTLSTIFSEEYSLKTDSLLLSSKYGKSKLPQAKVMAAILATTGVWLIVQVVNLLLVAWLFGLQGAHTFVQNWVYNNSPFAFTHFTHYLAFTFMSFLGALSFAAVIIFTSAKKKSPFISLLISSMVLLLPVMGGIANIGGFIGELLYFMPAQMLIAANHFIFFKAYYILGNAILMQHLVLVVAIVAATLMVPIACRTFQQWQVES
ncbi:MAG TPA: hypothetical protein DDZ53_05720 [Firmicutes bacterium]|nr:hypothetical protein [Bacillota bacterium]